jgi:hypothetical protein
MGAKINAVGNMKNMLRYGRHLLHAKGRHGTHSPFVYAIVENVLRSKKRFRLNTADRKFRSKEINLLIRTIYFIMPDRILADAALMNLLKAIISLPGLENIMVTEINEHHVAQPSNEKILLLSDSTRADSVALLSTAIRKSIVSVLLLNPHTNKSSEESWQLLSALPEIKMRLDLWHFGLLLNDPAFKASQYFRLR